MTKITYLLGAGSSYNACPIWNLQAKAMVSLGQQELTKHYIENISKNNPPTDWLSKEAQKYITTDKQKILKEILHFGKKAQEFNTIDTYARKLFLQEKNKELELLKMSVSVFFDLWENYNKQLNFYPRSNSSDKSDKSWDKIDQRYIALFSIFLEKKNENLLLNDDINFITWNYDLQLESTYNLFANDSSDPDFNLIDAVFPFLEKSNTNLNNKVFHLNGHRGFALSRSEKPMVLRNNETIENYWKLHEKLYSNLKTGTQTFNHHIKYGWEHNIESEWFKQIGMILKQSDILIIIGYSFPLFNRKIDQFLFSHLHPNKIKEIVYQDPYSDEEKILNLFKYPDRYKNKIKLLKEVDQFHIPHSHFIDLPKATPFIIR
ncbi:MULTISPECIES: hypothetical protein [Leeuwenhoekiella]|uniref:hypothetical protein n=2 Tax=Flavobacteriaceae TaxID=49546 RepID=UPI000C63CC3C|nr:MULTISPECIES: hypothetical protein [Leeuwenhoekiella]MAO43319.1 hypothetical protein [Leeuwenhoekiella sp.]|tara:strand:+ start:14987 stop:16114 length:1128 start_codon:yes stop_codon:yes gene_type:complete